MLSLSMVFDLSSFSFLCHVKFVVTFLCSFSSMSSLDVLSAVKKASFLCRIFGLFPFYETNGVFVISYISFYYSALFLVILFSVGSYFTFKESLLPEKFSFIDEINHVDFVVMGSISIATLYELFRNLNVFNDSIKTLQGIESFLGESAKYVGCNEKIFTIINMILSALAVVLRIWKNILQGGTVFEIIMFIGHFVIMLLQMIFVVQRYSGLMSIPTNLFYVCRKEVLSFRYIHLRDKVTRIEKLVNAYNILCTVSLQLNEIHTLQILLIVLTSFILCVSEAYLALVSLRADDDYKVLYFAIKIAWIAAGFNLCLQVVNTAQAISNQAKEFNILLYQLMIDDTTNEIANNKKLRLHVAMRREVVFTACGFFTLDFTLIHSMIAAATTYLVILIQFGQHTNPSSLSTDWPENSTDYSLSLTSSKNNS